ncbi:MAG: hypothetical protein WC965_01420 [Thiohalomonadaceae bacterium]
MMNSKLAWHFLHPGGKLRTGEPAPPDGEWLRVEGTLVPCAWGLHASERVIDALKYTTPIKNGAVLCRVELRGEVQAHGDPVDKLVARERKILWRLSAEETENVLREFARWAALQVINLWNAPDVVREFLETGKEELRAAADAAADAAAYDAAAYRAYAVAYAVAYAAAIDCDMARTQNEKLEEMVNKAHDEGRER